MSSKGKSPAGADGETALVPKLRFPEFEEAGEWNRYLISDFLDESRVPSDLNDPSKRITVRLHLQGIEHREHRGTESLETTNNFLRKSGQFIYGKQNIHKGAFGIIPSHLDGFETSQDIPSFDFKANCNPAWFYYHLSREEVYSHFELKMTGTGSKRLSERTFLSLPIDAPKYPEQQKIAECLESVDALVAAQGRKVEAMRAHKKGLMQQLFPQGGETEPRLRFPEFRDKGNWEQKTIGDIFKTSSGGTPDRSKVENWNGSIPWVTTSQIDFNVISDANEFISSKGLDSSSAKLFPKDTVLIALIGQGKTRGKVALLDFEASTNQNCAAILPSKTVIPNFVFQNLCGRYDEIRGQSNTAGQGSLSQGRIQALRFSYPKNKEEQQRIVDCLASLDDLIAAETRKLDTLGIHKKGLMQQLFPRPGMRDT